MRIGRMQWAAIVAAMVGLGVIGLVQLPKLMSSSLNHYQTAAYIKLGNMPVLTDSLAAQLAPFDYACFTTGWWDLPQNANMTKEVQKLNPKFQAGSYLTVWALADWMSRAPVGTINRDWYDSMIPFLCRSTEGDTAQVYPNAFMVNLLQPGAMDAIYGVFSRHLTTTSARQVKWLMLDFFSSPIPDMLAGNPQMVANRHGSVDMDGDGIGQEVDADEQAALKEAFHEYIAVIREIRPDIAIVPNGALAIVDPDFSRLVDGAYIEGFPQWFFGGAWQYDNALDPLYPHSLWMLDLPIRFKTSPGLVLVEDTYNTGIPGVLSGLFSSVVEVKRSRNDVEAPRKPIDLRKLGAPTATATYESGRISRNYEKGVLSITVTGGRTAFPRVDFR